jgi:hypothetical protein
MRRFVGISLFLISTTGMQAAVQYKYSAPALFGESATQLTYTPMAFVTANTTINLPDPSVVVTTPTTGSVPTQIQILSPTTTAAQFNVMYSDGTTIESNFGVNFIHEGSFPNGAGVRLTITAVPVFTKSFVPSTILPNGTSTLSFNISNPTALTMMGVAFTDALPAGVIVATPSVLTGACQGGSITASAGSSSVSLSGATFAPGATCTFSVNVVGTTEGSHANSAQVTTTNEGNGGTATATLLVGTPPSLTKSFGQASVGAMSSVVLSFTLKNPNASVTLDGLSFSDSLPAGLVISTPNGLTGSCGGGTITAVAGTSTVSLSGATLAAGASCTFSLNVTNNATIAGSLTNTTSTVTSNEAPPGAAASAALFLGNPFQFSYAANLNLGESYIDIANTGASGASLLGPGFGAATGNICANVYAFDPGEELIACCSCLITPDQTVNLGVNRDLSVKTLTGVVPTSVTVAVLSTLAGGDGTGTSCANSAAMVATAALANGVAAWGTTLHATPTAALATTERAFSGATLNSGELASLGGRCASILGNGSGFGVCNSCRAGALGSVPSQQ